MNLYVTADANWGIGHNENLLIQIPRNQKMFLEETKGKVVVMGRKTLATMPQGLPLAGRTNIVAQLEQMDPHRVARMIRQGSDTLAEMGRRVMVASCQMGASPEPVRKPAAPQKGGPVR